MNGHTIVDETDQSILRILSNYERLTPLQVWYELGEEDAGKSKPSTEEVLRRLESLRTRGFVERVSGIEVLGNSRLSIYRLKASTHMAGRGGRGLQL